ncbi:hypothetical protein QMK19_33885 [Streptomyces sp. H10-C2]|uniref:hypothetical protein n=1 Tax=unclassified Streptomyces TaxID=2593676 RepID=UPI0024BABFAC|nr:MULTISPECIES: hypothetical protein [unclassified Streptomyces]MDJ0345539.1 hypothetical protein [Streptomyces sp. PH10-H1]MDJ0374485.1 hypothetical protein [Streptomyces sp. H10-C2]
MSATSHTPPRALILAAPAGTYVMIRLVPAHGWGPAALIGALLLALLLWGPAVLRAGAKSLAVRNATKAAKAAKKESAK